MGVAWSMLYPILMMLILSAVFSNVFKINPLYIMTGQTLYMFFNEATSSANFSIVDSAQLVKKVYVPKYIFPIEKVLFAFINSLFSMTAIFAMMLIFKNPFSWRMLLFPVPLLALLIFSMGFGLLLSALCVFFRDLKHLYSIIVYAWMYLTPIIYPIEMVSESWIRYIVYVNPLTWYIEYFRVLVINQPNSIPMMQINLLCFGWAIVVLILGLLFFRKTQDKFILHI